MKYTDNTIIIPAARRTAANNALEAAGFGPDTFSVELTTGDPRGPTTHYGCSWTMTEAEIRQVLAILQGIGALAVHEREKFDEGLRKRNMVRKDK